ncbi:MAG: NAD(P)H-binding protein [Betaproteobacteria bacterium]
MSPPLPGLALLAGATGLVGREIATRWPGPVTLLVRRAVPAPRSGATVRVVDFAALPALPAAEAAFCALGTTIKAAGSQAAFRAVDFDAVLAFARACRAAGVRRFAVVSALGADARSANFYSRVKGQAEDALRELGFEHLLIARPSLLLGDRATLGQPARPGERWGGRVAGWLGPLLPDSVRPVAAARVAQSLVTTLPVAPAGVTVLHSAALQRAAATP